MFELPDAKRYVCRPPSLTLGSQGRAHATTAVPATDGLTNRVRREDLFDSASERHSSPELQDEEAAELRAKLNERLAGLLSISIPPPPPAAPAPAPAPEPEPGPEPAETAADADAEDSGEEPQRPQQREGGAKQGADKLEFEFRLFSTPAGAPAPATTSGTGAGASAPPPQKVVQKVVLLPDDEAEAPFDGPAIAPRPLSHYIRGELSEREREQFRRAAVTGREVLSWAAQRAWGLEVPWRVTRVTVSVGSGSAQGSRLGGGGTRGEDPGVVEVEGRRKKKKKTRPGKKRRIVLRKREKIRREKEAEAERLRMSKEEHLREKKKRLNREKKLKRRQKEREKKMAARAAGAAATATATATAATAGGDKEGRGPSASASASEGSDGED
ncbi:hypothetical protein MYCTH_2300915 [Thermothelomyces thermophilus ATCC 42464]|uniref:Uncharacterized protein n=1 Tax=Thermothelomyces thermophilus (strain ATCC 42464 / BCRC 31852 / DSM 1799) TaxID=573729 RepID=G2Q8H8_THET4|nr:uncharacterized protein MYCTH_2300915 [Thermothelomyces thermophilus ATCC 42464]AEO56227.1 hypothetical protein MYCTH_2300915 [Thermothelomyces thermophilus ATCC 42464]